MYVLVYYIYYAMRQFVHTIETCCSLSYSILILPIAVSASYLRLLYEILYYSILGVLYVRV